VISLGLGYTYMMPEYSKIQTLRTQNLEYMSAMNRIQRLAVLRDDLTANYNGISPENKGLLKRVIPEKLNTVELTADIANLAALHSITVSGIVFENKDQSGSRDDIANPPVKGPYKTVKMNLTTVGEYKNLIAFLKDAESSIQLLDVRSINIVQSNTGGVGSKTALNYKILIDTYSIQ
jgi:Tfp pilus assembly protein PilO